MNYFEILPLEILNQIIEKTNSVNAIASLRRVCKLFYHASKLYDKDLLEICNQKELDKMVKPGRDNYVYMFQGFYFNYFPAIRYAIKNGIEVDHCRNFIDINYDARDRSSHPSYFESRLVIWNKTLSQIKITSAFIEYAAHCVWSEVSIMKRTNCLYIDFYLRLLEMFIEKNFIPSKSVYKGCHYNIDAKQAIQTPQYAKQIEKFQILMNKICSNL